MSALKYHLDALKIDGEIGHKQGEAGELGNIGLIYSAKSDLESAFKYHLDALKIDREIGHKQGEALGLGHIGLTYSTKGDFTVALKYLHDALTILVNSNLVYLIDTIQEAIDDIQKKESTNKE